MPLLPTPSIRKVKSVISLENYSLKVGDEDGALVAWWYSGFYKNSRESSQPLVLVVFRKITPEGILDEVVKRRIPLGALGQVRIGTIWRGDRCKAEIEYKEQEFTVDLSMGKWRFTSFGEAMRRNASPPFPLHIHPLPVQKDRNWMIEFALPGGGKLLLPCMEFFSRCYGRSSELKRVLATYPWDGHGDTGMSRLYAPLEKPEEPGRWEVRLRKRLHNGDVIFLAHAKYDEYATYAAKSVYAQLEAAYDPELRDPAFIKIGPWFRGPAILKVAGVPFDGKSFLGLRIRGMSEPQGNAIFRGRENSRNAENPAPDGSPQAWAGVPEGKLVKYPEIIDLTGDAAPDQDAGSVEIQDPDFEVLGPSRAIIDVRPEQAKTKGGVGKGPSDVSAASGGEASGSGKGVGYASIHARPVFESKGVLRDMWEAMLSLQKTRQDVVQSVAWFTFTDKFQTDPTPILIPLEPFKDEDNVSSDVRRFPYMDVSTQSLRGLLVARLITPAGPVYIVEIMRRPRKISTDDGAVKDAEERFQGLVFKLDDENLLVSWMRQVAAHIRHETGVFRRITAACPGIAQSFSHRPSSTVNTDRLPAESVVLSALGKIIKFIEG